MGLAALDPPDETTDRRPAPLLVHPLRIKGRDPRQPVAKMRNTTERSSIWSPTASRPARIPIILRARALRRRCVRRSFGGCLKGVYEKGRSGRCRVGGARCKPPSGAARGGFALRSTHPTLAFSYTLSNPLRPVHRPAGPPSIPVGSGRDGRPGWRGRGSCRSDSGCRLAGRTARARSCGGLRWGRLVGRPDLAGAFPAFPLGRGSQGRRAGGRGNSASSARKAGSSRIGSMSGSVSRPTTSEKPRAFARRRQSIARSV